MILINEPTISRGGASCLYGVELLSRPINHRVGIGAKSLLSRAKIEKPEASGRSGLILSGVSESRTRAPRAACRAPCTACRAPRAVRPRAMRTTPTPAAPSTPAVPAAPPAPLEPPSSLASTPAAPSTPAVPAAPPAPLGPPSSFASPDVVRVAPTSPAPPRRSRRPRPPQSAGRTPASASLSAARPV
jgi:hypothetical protein